MNARVLCIDDDELNLSLLADVCELSGFDAVLASDPASGLAIWQRDRTDVVLLDLMMPGCSGLELLGTLAAGPDEAARAAVLMVSAVATSALQQEAFALGALDWVVKPFHVSDLQARIQLAVDLLAGARGTPAGDERLSGASVAAAMLGDRRIDTPSRVEVLLARGPDATAAFDLARRLRGAGGVGLAILAAGAGEVVAVWGPTGGLAERLEASLAGAREPLLYARGQAEIGRVAAEVARLRGA